VVEIDPRDASSTRRLSSACLLLVDLLAFLVCTLSLLVVVRHSSPWRVELLFDSSFLSVPISSSLVELMRTSLHLQFDTKPTG
jgi:hypothetical protein